MDAIVAIPEWTSEREAKLKDLWEAGLSASQITASLPMFSRSAIIGKANRMNLARRRQPNAARSSEPSTTRAPVVRPPKPPRPAPSIQRRNPSHSIVAKLKINAAEPGLPQYLQEPADGKGVTLFDLTNRTCRWPKGDPLSPDFLFCGETTADITAIPTRPYCPFHTLKSIDRTSVSARSKGVMRATR